MKKFKLILGILILAFLGLVIYQNQIYFLTEQELMLNLYFKHYTFPPIANGLYFLGCFAIGFLIMFFFSLVSKFRSKGEIKKLIAENTAHQEAIESLREELHIARTAPAGSENTETVSETTEASSATAPA